MKTGKQKKGGIPPAVKKPMTPAPGASKPLAASPPTASSPSKPSAKPSAAKTSTPNDDDDPFGVDTAMASRAIALSPRPAKGKTVRLICPMCETPGFAGHEAAGKEVKCCNEKCALPIFTAPKSEAPADPTADPRGSSMNASSSGTKKTSAPMVATAIATMVMAAGSVWYFVFNAPGPALPPPAPMNNGGGSTGVTTTLPNPNESEKSKVETKTEKTPAEKAIELRSQILPVMVDQSRQTDKNRSKHLCRRLAAEAYIEAGDLKAARDNLDQLLTLPPKLPFHRILPLTYIAWNEMAQGHDDAAKAALQEALASATELPESGRLTFDAKTELAALLAATGRTKEAAELLGKSQPNSGSSGQLAVLVRRVELLRTFDLDQAAVSLPIIPWKKPEWIAATITLTLRGHSDKALELIRTNPDAETKQDCLAAWGDAIVITPQSPARESDDPISSAVKDEPAANQARVWSRVAVARSALGLKASANKALENAAVAAKSIAAPSDFVLPDLRELSKLQLPDPLAPRLNAIAVAEVAHAQAVLGQTPAAAESLAAALQHLRGHAPSLAAAQKRFDATSRDGASELKAELKKTFNLKTDDQVNLSLTQYRAKCLAAVNAAKGRFDLQSELLKSAIDWPLIDSVWTEATARAAAGTPEESREEFLKSSLCVRLGQRLRAANKADQARQCETAATNGNFSDARDSLERETTTLLESGNVAAIAKLIAAHQATKSTDAKPGTSLEDSDWAVLWTYRLATRLSKQGKVEKAFELIAAFDKDMGLREEGYELLSAIAAQNPVAAEPLWKKYRPSLLSPTEKVSLFRGLCAGLSTVALAAK